MRTEDDAMKQQKENHCAETSRQVERMRQLYSKIGEPLPVNVIIDLHRHLSDALELKKGERSSQCEKKNHLQA